MVYAKSSESSHGKIILAHCTARHRRSEHFLAPSVRASLIEGSESLELRRSTRVLYSVYMAVSRLNNVFGVSLSRMASWPNLLRSPFGGQNIGISFQRLCILFAAE